jgi:hypothetical protein
MSPGGQDLVEFSVTVDGGVIQAVSMIPKGSNDVSKQYQAGFARELSGKVMGKKIADLGMDAIGGASLTTAAFRQFVGSF